MQKTYKTIEDDIIEDITEESLLSLDETLEAEAEHMQDIAEARIKARVKKEEDKDGEEDSDEMEEAIDGVGKEDDDVDNDGDSDETDAYLKNRRKKITAAIKKQNEEVQLEEGAFQDKLKKLNPGWDPKKAKGDFKNVYDPDDEEDAKDHAEYLKSADKFLDDISSFKPGVKIGDWVEVYVKNSPVKSKIGIGKIVAEEVLKGHDYGYMGYKGPSKIPGWQVKIFVEDVNDDYEAKEPNNYVMFNGKTYMNIGSAFYIQHEENQKDRFSKLSKQNLKVVDIKEEVELTEGASDLKVIAKKLGLSDAEVNKLEMQSTKQYSKRKGQTMLVDILKSVDDMSGPFRKAGMHYAKTGQFGMLDLIINDRDEDPMDENMKEEVDSSDITRLVESEVGLTEEFKEKATLIFETAVRTKVAETEATLKEEYATRLAEEVETIQEDLVEKIDSYLTYAVESWVADNKVAVESTLRTEIAENFITSLKSVFVENYIDVPEGKTDMVSEMETKLSESQEHATKLERIAESLAEKVETLSRANILAEASRDLADTQAAKLQTLSEDIDYIDADSFSKKVETLKEFYIVNRQIAKETIKEEDSYISTVTLVENETTGDEVSPIMKNYLTAISRLNNASTANIVS